MCLCLVSGVCVCVLFSCRLSPDAWCTGALVTDDSRLQSLAGVPLSRMIDRHRPTSCQACCFYLTPSSSPNHFLCLLRLSTGRRGRPLLPTHPISNFPKHFLSSHTLSARPPVPIQMFDADALRRPARISLFGPADFLPALLFSLFPLQDEASEPPDRPTDPARIYSAGP